MNAHDVKYGVQYYPEHWPQERWAVDAAMMQRAGINVVRMGEFAWSAYEPREGEIDFTWMEDAIRLLGKHGIQTILCTCSRTPPPWLYRKYPGILNVQPNGIPHEKDGRYRVALLHDVFIEHARRIDGGVIRHFAGHDNIVAWQLDNEIGDANDCHCPHCIEQFQKYLEAKYGTPEKLNEAWGEHFWSFRIDTFKDVPTPVRHPQVLLEYRRFMSHTNTAFARWRSDLIRQCAPGKQITTNFQNIHAIHTDCHELATAVDVNGMNHYPSRTPELAIDYYRGKRDTVWALEQHTRLRDVDTPAGWMRLWAWMTIAHGANAIVHFRWRQCRWGAEQFCDGILPHSGEENRFYGDLTRMGREVQSIGHLIAPTRPRAKAAILFSYASRWGIAVSGLARDLGPVHEAKMFHQALARVVTAVDAMDPHEDLSGYSLVIAPRLWMVDRAIAASLTQFVENGGTLCLTTGTGVVDEYGKGFDEPRPGRLHALAGIKVSDLAHQPNLRLNLRSSIVPALEGAVGEQIADEIHPLDAETVATHASGWRQGLPAITLHRKGKGNVVYVGTLLQQAGINAIVDWLCQISGIEQSFARPEGVSIYERFCDQYKLLFLVNWTDALQTVEIGKDWQDVFTGEALEAIQIPPNDLRITRHSTYES